MPRLLARAAEAAVWSHLQSRAPQKAAFSLFCGQEPFFLRPVRLLLSKHVARPLPAKARRMQTPAQGAFAQLAAVALAQMRCQKRCRPDRGSIAALKRLLSEFLHQALGTQISSKKRTARAPAIGQVFRTAALPVAREPLVHPLLGRSQNRRCLPAAEALRH